jgi:hypothetical protein
MSRFSSPSDLRRGSSALVAADPSGDRKDETADHSHIHLLENVSPPRIQFSKNGDDDSSTSGESIDVGRGHRRVSSRAGDDEASSCLGVAASGCERLLIAYRN